jgi:hypothetical protein
MSDMTGGCLCGRVRYVVTGEPMRSGLCHCRDCQRYTGSAFEPWLLLATNQVSLHGDMKTFDMTGGSGQVITCASNSSMRLSRAAICTISPSIRASSDATSWAPSLLSESIFLCGMASVNQLASLGSTPQTRVTTPQRGE